ncbi:glycosyltransferase family 4 protein [Patescibacteria group bacterium]|nr:glycosyltransferase family 4 protein [Patescibacteria group bacterium]
MKIHILYNFTDGPWGGGNQFLKALKSEFVRQGVYTELPGKADVLLVNSHHRLFEAMKYKILHRKHIVFRVDGPISLIRGKDRWLDIKISLFAKLFADGVIFQSEWSRQQNKKLFQLNNQYETVIYNAPNGDVFNTTDKKSFDPTRKIKLIATSWSANQRKGFDVYQYLDEHLDFSKYEMTFVGNSPVRFKKIKMIEPLPSEKLASVLKDHDMFITASKTDPCSNSLIEALSCGLPAVVLNDGGHPELIQDGGASFQGVEDVLEKIDLVANNYTYYRQQIPKLDLVDTAGRYFKFAMEVQKDI